MKKKSLVIILFLLLFVVFFPINSFTDWDPQKTVAIYFYNNYGQFMPKDIDSFGLEVTTYLNQNGIFVWFLGISQENIAIEKIKKLSKVYSVLEYSGDIVSVAGNKGDYKISVEVRLKGMNLNNKNKNFQDVISGEGDSMPDMSNARSLALQQIGVKLTKKNLENIKNLFDNK